MHIFLTSGVCWVSWPGDTRDVIEVAGVRGVGLGLLLNSTRVEPRCPEAARAKNGFPPLILAMRASRSGVVEASSDIASESLSPRIMVLKASFWRSNGISSTKSASYVVRLQVVRIVDSVRMIERGDPVPLYEIRHILFMPRTLWLKAVEVGLSRAQGGLFWLGSVRPRIWRVSSRDGNEIWKTGAVDVAWDVSSSSSSSKSSGSRGGGGGALKV